MKRTYPFEPLPLPYRMGQLSPWLNFRTVSVHYNMHYRKYVNDLNTLLKTQPQLWGLSLEEILSQLSALPEGAAGAIMRSAGGVFNHELYFGLMHRSSETLPSSKLRFALGETFGSMEDFRLKFTNACLSVFGSGYGWLAADKNGRLLIVTTSGQETPLEHGLRPILCCDMWEHAYYLQYQNRRDNYISAFFRVINYKAAEASLMKAVSG